MRLRVKEYVKTLLVQENVMQKDLAKMLSEKTGHFYSADNISKKINRQTLSFNEVLDIADVLGYRIEFIKEN